MVCTVARKNPAKSAWHEQFLKMLPAIAKHIRIAFRHLPTEAKTEAVQEATCNACCAFSRLAELGKLDLAYPSVLARYAVAQVRDGRKVGGRLNVRDVLSPYCQRCKQITVERLDHFDEEENAWKEAVVQDTRTTPVPEIVSFRVDFADWLAGLSRRNRRIAQTLALGNQTGDVAKRFKLSEGRVSQLRREFAESWQKFVDGEPGDGQATVAVA